MRGLAALCVTLVMTGCTQFKTACEPPTIPLELLEPLPPLTEPTSASCDALLDSYIDNLSTCAVYGVRYKSLIEAVTE